MKISKYNTGLYDILLIEIEPKPLEVEILKDKKILKINNEVINLLDYLSDEYREIKIIGIMSLLKERHYKSLVKIDTVYKKQIFTQKATKKFLSIIEDWDIDLNLTLIVRI